MTAESPRYVSRAGEKLHAALAAWHESLPALHEATAADFGANVGGFTHCLLEWGVPRVYAIDTGYGVLAWTLRQDERVVVLERTNALHVKVPEQPDLITIDVAWTRQRHILPAAARLLGPEGRIISLVKLQYEAARQERRGGVLVPGTEQAVLERTRRDARDAGTVILEELESPLRGAKGNPEYLWLLRTAV